VWHPRLAQPAAEDHPNWPWVEPEPWPGEPAATLDRLLDRYAALMVRAMDHDEEHLASFGRG
jgi:hypothetical protein